MPLGAFSQRASFIYLDYKEVSEGQGPSGSHSQGGSRARRRSGCCSYTPSTPPWLAGPGTRLPLPPGRQAAEARSPLRL